MHVQLKRVNEPLKVSESVAMSNLPILRTAPQNLDGGLSLSAKLPTEISGMCIDPVVWPQLNLTKDIQKKLVGYVQFTSE